jgi:Flp pilus assembly protein TadG
MSEEKPAQNIPASDDRLLCQRGDVCLPPQLTHGGAENSGSMALEAAFLLPALTLVALGVMQFGLVLNNYAMLTDAAGAGLRQLTIERGFPTPYTDAVNQITGTATALSTSNLSITLSVNGAACASDAACVTALINAQGQAAQVTVSYSCSLQLTPLLPNPCPLTSTIFGLVQ